MHSVKIPVILIVNKKILLITFNIEWSPDNNDSDNDVEGGGVR